MDRRLADDFDLEVDLERDDLAWLLDRALALLPPETREILVQKYVEECPQADVAARLGLTEGAVEARLQRGKLALRRVLTTDVRRRCVRTDRVARRRLAGDAHLVCGLR
jgi:RNA polymerase sigma factor (sigma-70 family)